MVDYRTIVDGLRRAATGVMYDAEEALKESGDAIVADMKSLVPVKTGALKDSIRAEIEKSDKEVSCLIYADAKSVPGPDMTNSPSVPYAEFVEYGTGKYNDKGDGRQDAWHYQTPDGEWHTTRGQKPQPFIRPALAQNEEKIDTRIGELVDITKYMKG